MAKQLILGFLVLFSMTSCLQEDQNGSAEDGAASKNELPRPGGDYTGFQGRSVVKSVYMKWGTEKPTLQVLPNFKALIQVAPGSFTPKEVNDPDPFFFFDLGELKKAPTPGEEIDISGKKPVSYSDLLWASVAAVYQEELYEKLFVTYKSLEEAAKDPANSLLGLANVAAWFRFVTKEESTSKLAEIAEIVVRKDLTFITANTRYQDSRVELSNLKTYLYQLNEKPLWDTGSEIDWNSSLAGITPTNATRAGTTYSIPSMMDLYVLFDSAKSSVKGAYPGSLNVIQNFYFDATGTVVDLWNGPQLPDPGPGTAQNAFPFPFSKDTKLNGHVYLENKP